MSATLEGLVGDLADGREVDWDAARRDAAEPGVQVLIDQLTLLDSIARLHRGSVDPGESDPHESTDVLGSSWGPYQLHEEIGKGSYGVVYRAHDPSLKRDLAIKVLHPSIAEQPVLSNRIYKEGQALARIHHPNVVAVYAVGPYNDRLGLCMELVRGRTLSDVVETQRLMNAEEAAVVGQFVCRALNAVHKAGLVHRDVTARNVMRDEMGRIVLMDFGTGLEFAASAQGERAAGTPLYMAPELFDGATATPQTDLYSVGVLLHYLVTQRYPVEGKSVADVIRAHRRGTTRLVSEHRADLPDAFVRVVSKAIAANSADRFASAAELEAALGQIAASQPAPAPSFHWRGVTAALFAVLGGVVGLAFLGRLSSYAFNTVLDLPEPFSRMPWTEALRWGAKSAVAPLAMAVALAVAYFLADSLVQLVKGSSIGDLLGRRLGSLRRTAQQLGLDRTIGAARLVVLMSVAFFLWARYVRFPALVDTYTTSLTQLTREQLWMLSSANAAEQDVYRMVLSMAVFAVIGCWIGIFHRAWARREPVPAAMEIAALGTVLVPLLLLNWPYRVFLHADAERAIHQQMTCHVLGEREASMLLLCPQRGRRPFPVRRGPDTTKLDERSNVFDALVASAP